MDVMLAGAKWSTCLVYMDDIVIIGKTFHQHLTNVQDVLDKLRQAGLHLKPGKCTFFQEEVSYLGHVVSARGVATDPHEDQESGNMARAKVIGRASGMSKTGQLLQAIHQELCSYCQAPPPVD